jgi:predicted DNA-binding protein with PD1-like motif
MPGAKMAGVDYRPYRLSPGEDLKDALEAWLAATGAPAAFVVAGIGSLDRAAIRYAGEPDAGLAEGRFEILTLQGSLSADGAHLHISVSDAKGRVRGGHVKPGCRIATTAEILIALLPGVRFARAVDAATGYPELVVTTVRT